MKINILFVVLCVTVCHGAINKQAIQQAVVAFANKNNAPSISTLIRYACGANPTAKSVVQKLKDVKPPALNCFLVETCSYKNEAQQPNVDFNALFQKVSEGVVRKCAQFMSQFTQLIPELQSLMTQSPSSLINIANFPPVAKQILDLVSNLMKDINENPNLVNTPQFGQRVNAIVTRTLNMPAQPRQAIARIFPDAGPFILPKGGRKGQFNNYLQLLRKDANGKITPKEKTQFTNLAVVLCEAGVQALAKNARITFNQLGKLQIPPVIQNDPAINAACQVVSPFFVQKARPVVNNNRPKFINGLVQLATEFANYCKAYPNPFIGTADMVKNTLKYRMNIPWDAIPVCD